MNVTIGLAWSLYRPVQAVAFVPWALTSLMFKAPPQFLLLHVLLHTQPLPPCPLAWAPLALSCRCPPYRLLPHFCSLGLLTCLLPGEAARGVLPCQECPRYTVGLPGHRQGPHLAAPQAVGGEGGGQCGRRGGRGDCGGRGSPSGVLRGGRAGALRGEDVQRWDASPMTRSFLAIMDEMDASTPRYKDSCVS